MNSSYDDNNDPLDPFLDDITQSMSQYISNRLILLQAEIKLETLIREDMVEILTDPNGNFTYRITPKGSKAFAEKTGQIAATNDITFLQFAGINS